MSFKWKTLQLKCQADDCSVCITLKYTTAHSTVLWHELMWKYFVLWYRWLLKWKMSTPKASNNICSVKRYIQLVSAPIWTLLSLFYRSHHIRDEMWQSKNINIRYYSYIYMSNMYIGYKLQINTTIRYSST